MEMNNSNIIEKPLGKIQIYLKPKDKIKSTSIIEMLKPKQLYRELIKYAKNDGLMNASVYHTHCSFSLNDKIRMAHPELDNADVALCLELIDEKSKLEEFCKKHGSLLKGKMIVFKAVEYWEIT